MGGTGVEIYRDTTMRMAPLKEKDVESMVRSLKAHQLLEGYRGSEPVNLKELTRMLVAFSDLVMEIEGQIESIDLNPLLCTADRCVVADARIMLKAKRTPNVPGIPK
jgi:acyl-CoA synthetase (NDP forming)